MFKKKIRSVISLNNSSKEIRVIPQKNNFENGISKIFSKEPSHSGYKGDIENLINDIGFKEEDFLNLTIVSLSKIVRNKNDSRIIASYLFSMPNLIKLLKGNDNNNKTEQDILKDLLNLSKSITYEKFERDHILMRLGDIGSTAYILLNGNADVLIKNFRIMSITKYDYLYYLANLIKYSEYGLLNDAINENFSVYPVELEEDKENIVKIDDTFHSRSNVRNLTYQNLFEKSNKNVRDSLNLFNKTNTEQGSLKKNSINKNKNTNFKLTEKNLELSLHKKPLTITEEKLLELFNMKKINTKHLHCSITEYINRLKLTPGDYRFFINQSLMNKIEKEMEQENKSNENYKRKSKVEDNSNTLFYFKIYSYVKVATLGKGTLFGELALTQEDSLRTGTIITSKECDISVLNRKIFNNCLRKGAVAHIKKLLTFFIQLPIFNGISEYIFYNKYYSYLSKKVMTRGNILINQGETPKEIFLLHSGSYGISSRISLESLTNLILYLIKENLNENNTNKEEVINYQKLLMKMTKIINKTKSLISENPKFKNFYTKEINIRVSELSTPDIIGFKEYLNENGVYAFTIETHSIENVFYVIDNKFYSEILDKNSTIRKNLMKFSEKKINVIIQRLIILRNCFVNFFFENKVEKLNTAVSRELDIINYSKIRKKSALRKRITEYNFTTEKKEIEQKSKRIGRNYLIPKKEFNSFSKETTKNDLSKKNNSFSSNLHIINNKNLNQLKSLPNNINISYKTSNNDFKKSKKIFVFEPKSNNSNSKNSIKDNFQKFHEIKKKHLLKIRDKDKEEIKNNYYYEIKNRMEKNLPRLNSSSNSLKKIKCSGFLLNNMVLEEITKKMKIARINDDSRKMKVHHLMSSLMTNSFKLNGEKNLMTSFSKYKDLIIQCKHPSLKKSASELSFKNLRVKSTINRNIQTSKNRYTNLNKDIKIDLKIKRVFSPLGTSSSKIKDDSIFNRIKINNDEVKKSIKLNKKFFNNTLNNRIRLFYNNFKNSKK